MYLTSSDLHRTLGPSGQPISIYVGSLIGNSKLRFLFAFDKCLNRVFSNFGTVLYIKEIGQSHLRYLIRKTPPLHFAYGLLPHLQLRFCHHVCKILPKIPSLRNQKHLQCGSFVHLYKQKEHSLCFWDSNSKLFSKGRPSIYIAKPSSYREHDDLVPWYKNLLRWVDLPLFCSASLSVGPNKRVQAMSLKV